MILFKTPTHLIQFPVSEMEVMALRKTSKNNYEVVFADGLARFDMGDNEEVALQKFDRIVQKVTTALHKPSMMNTVIDIPYIVNNDNPAIAELKPLQPKPSKSKTNKKDDNDVNESR